MYYKPSETYSPVGGVLKVEGRAFSSRVMKMSKVEENVEKRKFDQNTRTPPFHVMALRE